MNVLLIYPDTDPLSIIPSGLINIEPLGLEYLAAELNHHDVRILDMKVDSDWKGVIERRRPDVVGITGTVVHKTRMLEILAYVKRTVPKAQTVVGGPHATLVPADFHSDFVDVIIPGQQSEVFRETVEHIEAGFSLSDLSGVIFRDDTGWHATTPARKPRSLDHLPLPRRDLTAAYRSSYHHLVWQPVALMVTSIGCPHACKFCPCPVLTDRSVLRRSPERVIDEMRQIDEPYVYIADDNLFFDHRHADRIARLVEEEKLKKHFYVLSRADDIVKHPETIERWASIGLKKVFIGLESPSDRELKSLNKKGSVSLNNQAIEILHANNIDPLGAFVIPPDYTREDFDRILDYMDRMRIYYFEFTILTPFPGTKFHEESRDQILSHDTRLYDLAHSVFSTRLPIDEFYREYHRLHRRAASLRRALRIRPVVSPFLRMGLVRQAPQLAGLFISAKRAYRELDRMNSSG